MGELVQKIARAQARQGMRLEEIESKLEAGFSDLRTAIETTPAASESALSFEECFDAMDALEEAARFEPDAARAQGLRGVLERLKRFLVRAGFERQTPTGQALDARLFRVVGTEATESLAPGQVVRVVRAAVLRQGKLTREGEVIVSARSS
jgi:molecular chaperone GrpE (heat shock protein)